jgi:uncharacterized protein (TIGR02246 family)
MKPTLTLCAVTALAFTLTACNQAPPDTHDADVKAITDTEAQWDQDYAAKDADKAAAHYTDDAALMVAGGPPTSGKDAIHAALKGMLADPAFNLKFQATRVEVAKSGDLGFTQGTYTLDITDPVTKQVVHDHGNYVTTYRKQPDGSWKAVSDAAVSSVPPPTPAPPTPAKKKR